MAESARSVESASTMIRGIGLPPRGGIVRSTVSRLGARAHGHSSQVRVRVFDFESALTTDLDIHPAPLSRANAWGTAPITLALQLIDDEVVDTWHPQAPDRGRSA